MTIVAWKRRVALSLLILPMLGAFAFARAEGRVALVVGVSRYEDPGLQPLPNAVADADAIGAKLRSLGFDTDILLEPTRDEFRRALSALFRRRQQSQADTALIYFAGHGVQTGNKGFLLARDSRLAPRTTLEQRQEVSMTDLLKRLGETKLTLLFLDACRNTPALAGSLERRTDDTLSAGLPGFGDRTGFQAVVSYATLPNARALDAIGERRNSPYAEALLDYLGRAGVEIATMLRGVDRFVYNLTAGAQEPTFEDRREPGATFFFNTGTLRPASAPGASTPPASSGNASPAEAIASLGAKSGAARASALSGLLAAPGLAAPVSTVAAMDLLGDISDDAGRRRRALSALLPLMDLPLAPRDAQRLLAGLSETSRLVALTDMLGCLARPLSEMQAQWLVEGIPRNDIRRVFSQLTSPSTPSRCGS